MGAFLPLSYARALVHHIHFIHKSVALVLVKQNAKSTVAHSQDFFSFQNKQRKGNILWKGRYLITKVEYVLYQNEKRALTCRLVYY